MSDDAFLPEDEEPEADPGRLSYRQLVWRRFKKSKLALVGSVILAVFYVVALFAEFFAPYDAGHDNIRLRYVPPQRVRFFEAGRFLGPFVYGLKPARDPET